MELKKNIKDAWWRDVVQARDDIVGLDSSIIGNPKARHVFVRFFRGREGEGGRGRGRGGRDGGCRLYLFHASLCLTAIDPRMPTMPGSRVFTDQARG